MKLITAFKTIFTALIFIISSNYSSAQKTQNYDQGFRLGIGISGGLPIEKPYDFNLGADARLQYDLSK